MLRIDHDSPAQYAPRTRERRRAIVLGLAALAVAPRAIAATDDGVYPNRPIRCILPSTPGGTSDLIARIFAAHLGEALGQPIVIEAKPGAAGRIAVEHVAASPPDGYTLLLANNGANAIVPGGRGTALDTGAHFAAVIMLARLPIVIAVTHGSGIDSLDRLIGRAKAAPGRITYASSGVGSTSQIAAALLAQNAGIDIVHVPYAGTSAAVKDVLAGDVTLLFTHIGTVSGLVKAGQLRALAVTGNHRMPILPAVPTVAESGFPGFDVTTWHGILAPPATPRDVVTRLNTELLRALALPEVRRQLEALGMEPIGDTPEHFAAVIDADVRRWGELIRKRGIATQ